MFFAASVFFMDNIHAGIREWRMSTVEQTEKWMERVGIKKYRSAKIKTNHRKGVQEVANHLTSSWRMKHPSEHFCESIRNGKDTQHMSHENVFGIRLVLDDKMMYINLAAEPLLPMLRLFTGCLVIDKKTNSQTWQSFCNLNAFNCT